MRATTTLKVVHRMIEKPHHDPAFADTELHAVEPTEIIDLQDTYDYYPDFGI